MLLKGLKGSYSFERVLREGRFAVKHGLALYIAENGSSVSRFGVSVSVKVGKPVVRNRYRRWAREIMRELSPSIKPGVDIVLLIRGNDVSFAEFHSRLIYLLRNRGVLEGEGDTRGLGNLNSPG